jgi:hypothetical protein
MSLLINFFAVEMKITKTKEVITEEIEVEIGTYYFEDESLFTYKIEIKDSEEDDYCDYIMEIVSNFSNICGIRIKDDFCNSENVPYEFRQFILGIAGKKITKEEFEKEKQEVLKRLI